MGRSPLSAPGQHLPQQGWTRADIWGRVGLFGLLFVVAPTAVWTLWLAGQVGGLLTHGAWPYSDPSDAFGVAVHLPVHLADPAGAWPPWAADRVAPAALLYPLWTVSFVVHLGVAGAAVVLPARRRVRRKGFARRGDVNAL